MALKEKYELVQEFLGENFAGLSSMLQTTYDANPYKKDELQYKQWQEQCAINIPLLYLASLYLYKYGEEHNCTTYLFSTRDCCHWYRIFSKMYPDKEVYYFDCSRNMFKVATRYKRKGYRKYVKEIADKNSLYIDIHGKGNHMIDFFRENFKYTPGCFFLSTGHSRYVDMPPQCLELYKRDRLHSIAFYAHGGPIEMLNYDNIGTLQDYDDKKGPKRDSLEYKEKLIKPYHECINTFLNNLTVIDEHYDLKLLGKAVRKMFKWIRSSNQKPVISKYIEHVRSHPNKLI